MRSTSLFGYPCRRNERPTAGEVDTIKQLWRKFQYVSLERFYFMLVAAKGDGS